MLSSSVVSGCRCLTERLRRLISTGPLLYTFGHPGLVVFHTSVQHMHTDLLPLRPTAVCSRAGGGEHRSGQPTVKTRRVWRVCISPWVGLGGGGAGSIQHIHIRRWLSMPFSCQSSHWSPLDATRALSLSLAPYLSLRLLAAVSLTHFFLLGCHAQLVQRLRPSVRSEEYSLERVSGFGHRFSQVGGTHGQEVDVAPPPVAMKCRIFRSRPGCAGLTKTG